MTAAIERIVRAIPSVPALADQLAERSARLDALAAAKQPLPRGERIVVDAMRAEYRRRTGERI